MLHNDITYTSLVLIDVNINSINAIICFMSSSGYYKLAYIYSKPDYMKLLS